MSEKESSLKSDPSPDLFGALVILLQSVPAIHFIFGDAKLPIGKHDHFVVRLVFIANLVKVMMTFRWSPASQVKPEEIHPEEEKAVNRLSKQVSEVSGSHHAMNVAGKAGNTSALTLAQTVKSRLLRFLRCAALYVHFYTDVPLPERAGEEGEATPDKVYQALCTYLGLPVTLAELVESDGFSETVDMFLNACSPADLVQDSEPLTRRNLIELKQDYLEMLALGDSYKVCPKTGQDVNDPALCLVCGSLVCFATTCCQGEVETADGKIMCGGCTVHAQTCAGGTGIFLRIKRCSVVLLSDARRGANLAAPYVDEFGEVDLGLQRGNPLRLEPSLYAEINNLWLNNDIPDKIARVHNRSNGGFGTRWYSL